MQKDSTSSLETRVRRVYMVAERYFSTHHNINLTSWRESIIMYIREKMHGNPDDAPPPVSLVRSAFLWPVKEAPVLDPKSSSSSDRSGNSEVEGLVGMFLEKLRIDPSGVWEELLADEPLPIASVWPDRSELLDPAIAPIQSTTPEKLSVNNLGLWVAGAGVVLSVLMLLYFFTPMIVTLLSVVFSPFTLLCVALGAVAYSVALKFGRPQVAAASIGVAAFLFGVVIILWVMAPNKSKVTVVTASAPSSAPNRVVPPTPVQSPTERQAKSLEDVADEAKRFANSNVASSVALQSMDRRFAEQNRLLAKQNELLERIAARPSAAAVTTTVVPAVPTPVRPAVRSKQPAPKKPAVRTRKTNQGGRTYIHTDIHSGSIEFTDSSGRGAPNKHIYPSGKP